MFKKKAFEMKMVSPQINLVVVFYFKFHLGIEYGC